MSEKKLHEAETSSKLLDALRNGYSANHEEDTALFFYAEGKRKICSFYALTDSNKFEMVRQSTI